MYTTTHAEPAPTEVGAWMFEGARGHRLRVLLCSDGRIMNATPRQRDTLWRQLRAARTFGDRAAELMLCARLWPTTCTTFDCTRKARPDGRLCQDHFERLVGGQSA